METNKCDFLFAYNTGFKFGFSRLFWSLIYPYIKQCLVLKTQTGQTMVVWAEQRYCSKS